MALLDGFGLRALLRDPQMDLATARRKIAGILGPQVGVDPRLLAD